LFEKDYSFIFLFWNYHSMLLLGILCAQKNKLLRSVFVASANGFVL